MKVSLRVAILAVAAMDAARPQNLSVGGALGTNLTANFQPFATAPGLPYSDTRTLLGGVQVEWNLGGALEIEADGLYRRMHALGGEGSHFSVVTWEFPVLAKYRWTLPHLRPFVESGPALRATGNLNEIHPSHYGFLFGAGLERQVGRFRIEPAIRYTRWAQDLRESPAGIGTKADQIELVVGVGAPALSNGRPFGARVSVGAVVGVNLTGDFGTATASAVPEALANISLRNQLADGNFVTSAGPRSFLGGPSVAMELKKNLALEVQAIYRPLRSAVEVLVPGAQTPFTVQAHRTGWEFPVLARYRWRASRATPFLEVGPAFRLLQDLYGATPYGVTVGAGVEARAGSMRIAPGVRFTHWAAYQPASAADPRRNEVAVMTGLSF